MTPEDIERMARECIAEDWDDHLPGYYRNMDIERFASLVRAQALEEAAILIKAAEAVISDYDRASNEKYDELRWDAFGGVETLRDAIRALASK